jgi:hypothetical protein
LPAAEALRRFVAVILEAPARILELHGFEGFNTNAIAERAGMGNEVLDSPNLTRGYLASALVKLASPLVAYKSLPKSTIAYSTLLMASAQ